MPESVNLDWTDEVATITVNRPDRMNSLDLETLTGLQDAIATANDEGARCLVLTGAGDDAFVAGADIAHMVDLSTEQAHEYAELGHRITDGLESFPAPTIAALNGFAFGGGCELAIACDLRVASDNAVLGQTEIDLGIIPGWGGTQRLQRLVGDETARRLVFFGERVDAETALEFGLVGEVVPHDRLDDHVAELAAELATKPRFALQAAKEALNVAAESPQAVALDFERRTWASLFGTPDQREGMQAFLDDRDPEFE